MNFAEIDVRHVVHTCLPCEYVGRRGGGRTGLFVDSAERRHLRTHPTSLSDSGFHVQDTLVPDEDGLVARKISGLRQLSRA